MPTGSMRLVLYAAWGLSASAQADIWLTLAPRGRAAQRSSTLSLQCSDPSSSRTTFGQFDEWTNDLPDITLKAAVSLTLCECAAMRSPFAVTVPPFAGPAPLPIR